MHNEPQISSRGEWGDASIVADNKGRINYYCQYCGFKCRIIETIKLHYIKCIEDNSKLQDGIDYVVCKICNFHAQNLGIHLKKIHDILSEDYKKQYNCKTTSEKSNKKYSENHFQYLKDAKEKGVDLAEYWQKVSIGVSEAIVNNDNEIERRAEMMIVLNNKQKIDPFFQKIISAAAKKTSSRPEIIGARTQQLAQWRKNYPEDFYNKCIIPMITTFQSKPEIMLFEYVKSINEFDFKRNQFINSLLIISKSHNKQVDMGDKKRRVYIEFDGVLHFFPKYGPDVLHRIKNKDLQLDSHISNHNWTLIRVSYDQFIYKTKIINKIKHDCSYFKQDCLDKILEILNNKVTGIYRIGDAYGKY